MKFYLPDAPIWALGSLCRFCLLKLIFVHPLLSLGFIMDPLVLHKIPHQSNYIQGVMGSIFTNGGSSE